MFQILKIHYESSLRLSCISRRALVFGPGRCQLYSHRYLVPNGWIAYLEHAIAWSVSSPAHGPWPLSECETLVVRLQCSNDRLSLMFDKPFLPRRGNTRARRRTVGQTSDYYYLSAKDPAEPRMGESGSHWESTGSGDKPDQPVIQPVRSPPGLHHPARPSVWSRNLPTPAGTRVGRLMEEAMEAITERDTYHIRSSVRRWARTTWLPIV